MNAVTGAFGYTGKYITRRLLTLGESVLTLTGHPGRSNEFGASVKAFPFRFGDPAAMAESLSGVRVLYNTYWIRFDHDKTTYGRAVANTCALIRAAEIAGVERVVHISITNPDPESPLPYFRGKALLEEEIRKARFSYAIVRPTVVFGMEDILINNIAIYFESFHYSSSLARVDTGFSDPCRRSCQDCCRGGTLAWQHGDRRSWSGDFLIRGVSVFASTGR